MKKLFIATILTVFLLTTCVFADEIQYKSTPIGEIDIDVYLPEQLIVFTRAVTDSNKNLELIDTTASKLISDMKSKNLYLYAVDSELTYDVSLQAKKTKREDLKNLSKEDLNDIIDSKSTDLKETKNLLYESAEIVNHNDVTFINFKYKLLNEFDTENVVYISNYYTVYKGQEINFQLQSYKKVIEGDLLEQFNTSVQKTKFIELEGNTGKTGYLNGTLEMLISCGSIILVLGVILLLLKKNSKKKDNYI